MLNIGCHLSSSKGFKHMGKEALSINANTFQFFSRNPRGSKAKAVDEKDTAALNEILKENNFAPVLAHAPYTLNACSSDAGLREFAKNTMASDLEIMEYIPGNLYNFHPGSHVGQGVDTAIDFITDMLNSILKEEYRTTVLLETMSGKGSEVGSTFEEIHTIIDRVELNHKLGVCLDTCHIFSAGYDIVHDLEGVLEKFDKVIGLERLKAVHLNDSMMPYNSRKDRHEKIGKGTIGLDAVINFINHPKLRHLPFYLETPNELDGYAAEIKLIKTKHKINDKNIIFSSDALKELNNIIKLVEEFCHQVEKLYISGNKLKEINLFAENEEHIDQMRKTYKKNHLKRLDAGVCSLPAGLAFIDLLNTLEKIADNTYAIAQLIEDEN